MVRLAVVIKSALAESARRSATEDGHSNKIFFGLTPSFEVVIKEIKNYSAKMSDGSRS
jgi:hypothetical protein